jgi:tetratricopeptide (TPR) repeat protein
MPVNPSPPQPVPSGPWFVWLGAALIILAGFAAYHRSLDAPFVFDDIPAVVQNQSIRDLSSLGRVLNPPAEGAGMDSRPMVNLSLALNYAAGGLNPRGYRLTNIAVHVLGALALFGIVRRTLALPSIPPRLQAAALPAAFATALLWTVHPLQTETVICVIQRTEGIVSLWFLVTLYAFARAVEPAGNRRWLAVCWFACLLGMASKEVMVGAPLVAFLYDRTFVAGSFREAWCRRWRWHAALASTWILLAWLVLDSGGNRGGTAGFGQGVSAWTYLLTQAKAITLYLKLSVWPHPLVIDYGAWLAPGLRAVLGEFLFIGALFATTVWAVVRHPRVGFLGACFFAILAPSSSIYPLVSQTITEHRMHLPLAAVLTLLVTGLFHLPRRLALAVCLLAATAGIAGTLRRSADYASELSLWSDLVEKTPSNPWARFHLGRTYYQLGRLAEAERENRAAIELMPTLADAHFALGLALERQGRLEEAANRYLHTAELKPGYTEAHFRTGLILLRLGRPAEALPRFAEAVRLQPDHADAEGNWGAALYQLGRIPEALPHFERVLTLRPDSVEARHNLALLLMQLDRPAEALPHLEAAAALTPGDREILGHLSRVRSRLGRADEARRLDAPLADPGP